MTQFERSICVLAVSRQLASVKTFITALSSLTMLWLAFPPVGWFWLAWLAPIPLVWLVMKDRLDGKRPYLQLWWAGLAYWLATFYFLPIPHPALWLGWIALGIYLAVYTPLLVGISRLILNRWKLPAWLAFAVVFTGLEWIRCHFATGMAMVCLSHSQYRQPLLIQVADIGGAYTLTFSMTLFAAGLAVMVAPGSKVKRIGAGLASTIVVLTVLNYGDRVLNAEKNQMSPDAQLTQIGIIQGSIDVIFIPITEEKQRADLNYHIQLTRRALEQWPDLELILWPESSFSLPDLISDFSETFSKEDAAADIKGFWQYLMTGRVDWYLEDDDQVPNFRSLPTLLAGGTTYDPANQHFFNAALLIEPPGKITQRYYKNHRVLLGEYVPLADRFPWIAAITPISRNLTAGTDFKAMRFSDFVMAPSICFETTVPHLIRRQVNTLSDRGEEPDVLVNLTNDGWFFGTSCLDLHLACNVFRSVEMKKPHLVCANTGFSAHIDPFGRLLQIGARREISLLNVAFRPHPLPTTIYRRWGNWLPALMGYIVIGAMIHGFLIKRKNEH